MPLQAAHLVERAVVSCEGMSLALVFGLFANHPGLADVVRFDCAFPIFVDYDDDVIRDNVDFNMEFLLDDVTGKAYLIGNAGVSEVSIHSGGYGMTFIETGGGGGWGDPGERENALIERDLREGWITADRAARDYPGHLREDR